MIVQRRLAPELSWFPEARFGMFVHFGIYALLGRGEWVQYRGPIPQAKYEKLRERFNPARFDADEWVDIAERGGCRYLCVTAKHHDGFCLFDSALTDYKITNTPFGGDLIGELVEACQRRGMRILLYYSQPDWHHPNFVHRRGWFKDLDDPPASDRPDWPKYLAYYHGQIEELCTNYERIDGIWFDGVQKSERDWQGRRVYDLIKRLQPAAVVNERAGFGDFFTPERSVSAEPAAAGYMVEGCQSISANAWGHREDSTLNNAPFLIESLVKMAAANGNYLLNVGPLPDGTIPEEQAARLADVGDWLRRHGEAIYGTTGTPERGGGDLLLTQRGATGYLHLLRWPENDAVEVTGLQRRPRSARLLATDQPLRLEPIDGGVRLRDLPSLPPDPAVNVIELSFTSARITVKPRPAPPAVVEVDGATNLDADAATLPGFGPKGFRAQLTVTRPADWGTMTPPETAIGRWTSTEQRARWELDVRRGGTYRVTLEIGCDTFHAGSRFSVTVGGGRLGGTVPDTGGHRAFADLELGEVELTAGRTSLAVRPTSLQVGYHFAAIRRIRLTPS